MYVLGFWGSVGSAIVDALRSFMLSLCDIIYKLIVYFANIFFKLGSAEIFTNDTIKEIYERVGLILGLFMVFNVIFSLIQYVLDPDKMLDKQKGMVNIVKKMIVVVVLLGVTPSLFRFAFELQEEIIDSNIIPRVITGKDIDTGNFGSDVAWTTFSSFFKFDDRVSSYTNPTDPDEGCFALVTTGNDGPSRLETDFIRNNSLRYAYNCVTNRVPIDETNDNYKVEPSFYTIDFAGHGLVAVIAGVIILWIIIMYTIQVGIRVIQLAYLQLIAPIPIISYLIPKGEDTLNKWVKQCVNTYLDFFMRVAIIYFAIFAIEFLIGHDNQDFLNSVGNPEGFDLALITVIMIIALLLFAKKAPDLIKDLFPKLGGAGKFSFGLNPKKGLNNTLAAGFIGGAVGAVGTGASNAIHGYMNTKKAFKEKGVGAGFKSLGKSVLSVGGGVVGGAKAGLKTKDISNVGNAVKVANENREKRELKAKAGYHWYNPIPTIEDKVLGFAGETTGAEKKIKEAKRQLETIEIARNAMWKRAEDLVKTPGSGVTAEDYAFVRTIKNVGTISKPIYEGRDNKGNIITFTDAELSSGSKAPITSAFYTEIVKNSDFDIQVKKQNDIIKGSETAKRDTKKQ